MPNDGTADDELQLEVIPEAESDVDTQTSENAEGESADVSVNLQDNAKVDKLSPAEENAKRQEETWLNKVISGKSKVEEAPQWLQSRLNARLEATAELPKTEDVVKQLLQKERKTQEFNDLQRQIPPLTKEQAKELTDRYNQLKGADNVAALKTVLDAMGLSQKLKEAEQRGMAKGRISLPRSGQPAVRKSEQTVGNVPLDVIHDEKKWNQMIRQGG